MNFLITGATGFIGKKLSEQLMNQGHHIYALSRSNKKYRNTKQITYIPYEIDPVLLPPIDGVINLAGESLFGYWTAKKKKEIRASRIKTTKKLIQLVKGLKKKPEVFINGSAVGYYGMRERMIFTENTTRAGSDFLSSVVLEWEETASKIEGQGIRVMYARFGIVLDKKDGAFPLMALPVKLFVGGKVGSGEQWISWIHAEDAARLLVFCLFNKNMQGPVNITAPNPKQNQMFYKAVAKRYRRPLWFPISARFIHLLLGEMALLITKGQYVYPKQAESNGFTFLYPKLNDALRHL